jgi:hypothetical protein
VSSKEELVAELLAFPDVHPYRKWWGTHWRLIELADAGVPVPQARLRPGVERELGWLVPALDGAAHLVVDGLARRHGSIEGNSVYALARLGFADHPGTRRIAESLIEWQWPDGGWNCDRRPGVRRSSFHESVTPALGLAAYADVTGDRAARVAADRTAELLLEHRLFRAHGTGEPVHPSWTALHYPAYWHYDVLQGLRLLQAVGRLDDPRASEALDLVERARRSDGRFSGRRWSSAAQPAAVEWGTGSENIMLNELAERVLAAAGRSA